MTLPLEAIDRLLSAWDERLARIDENLVALDSDPAYQMVSGTTGRDRYDGRSRQLVSEALDELATLFSDLERLRAVIDQARAVRASLKGMLWGKDEKSAQIEALLLGASVSRGVELRPLERRSLLDEGPRARAISPEALLAEMVRRYEAARDALLSVWRAWQALEPAVQRIEEQLRSIDEGVARLGLAATSVDGLVALRAEVARARSQAARDPLGTRSDFDARLTPRFQILRGTLANLETRRQQTSQTLASAEHDLLALHQLHRDAAARWDQLAASVELGPAALALLPPAADFDSLDAALAELKAPGGFQRMEILDTWRPRLESMRERLTRADRRARALLAAGADLQGRLSARRAQVASLTARGQAPAPAVARCLDEVAALLGSRPAALGRAASRLEQVDRALALRAEH